MSFSIKKMPLNALNLIYFKFHISPLIIIEDIDKIIKGALEVFLSVCRDDLFSLTANVNLIKRNRNDPGMAPY